MMSNNTIRSEGKPKIAMYAMFIPSVSNLCLDYLFIYELGLGMYGAALATTLSYFICGIYILLFFVQKKSDLKLNISDLKFDISIVKETVSLGFVTLSRQAAVSLTVLVVNNILFSLQGESMIAVYAIISRMLMFMLFPILGITQGFIPIAGYNFGAKNKDRVLNSVKKAIIYSTGMATVIFLFIYTFSDSSKCFHIRCKYNQQNIGCTYFSVYGDTNYWHSVNRFCIFPSNWEGFSSTNAYTFKTSIFFNTTSFFSFKNIWCIRCMDIISVGGAFIYCTYWDLFEF